MQNIIEKSTNFRCCFLYETNEYQLLDTQYNKIQAPILTCLIGKATFNFTPKIFKKLYLNNG